MAYLSDEALLSLAEFFSEVDAEAQLEERQLIESYEAELPDDSNDNFLVDFFDELWYNKGNKKERGKRWL